MKKRRIICLVVGICLLMMMVPNRANAAECTSDWILDYNMPIGSEVVAEKWTYTLKETTESTASSMSGWTEYGSYWSKTGGSSFYNATFPAGYDSNHQYYKDWNRSPYTSYENATTKRTATNAFYGYIYWHWTYEVADQSVDYRRPISSHMGTFTLGSATNYYNKFDAFFSKNEYDGPYTNLIVQNTLYGYSLQKWISSDHNSYSQCHACPCWFRFSLMKCTYTDYTKMHQYQRFTDKESATPVTASGTITNVQHWVKIKLHDFSSQTQSSATLKTEGSCIVQKEYYYSCVNCGECENNDEHTFFGAYGAHSLTKVPRVEPDHEHSGNIEYYVCSICGKCFIDSSGSNEISQEQTALAKQPHSYSSSWRSDEVQHWRECSCGAKTDIQNHSVNEATCIQKAFCYICGANVSEENTSNHVRTELRNDRAATEETEGYSGDRYCLDCGQLIESGTVIPRLAHSHDLEYTAWKASTCTASGNIAYWHCTKCDKYYSDADAVTEITLADTVIPAWGHNYQNNVCTRCGDVKEPDTIAVTGVTLDKTALTLTVGEQATLTATVMPSNATNKQVNWTSSNSSAATVSNGTVTAVKEGSAVITVRTADGNKTATCSVTVNKPALPPEPPVDPEDADVIFSMDQVSGKPGDTVYVGLYIDSKADINTVGVYLVNYPSDVMTFAGFENPGTIIIDSLTGSAGVDSEKGAVTFGYVGASKYSGKLCDLKFVINEDVQETNAEIQMSAIVKNGSAVLQTYVQPGTVSIKSFVLGDLNGDEIVNIEDAVALLQYSIFPDFYPLSYSGNIDFNHDGIITIDDAVLLLQYSIFPEFYPLT